MDRVRVGQADRPGEFVKAPLLDFAALKRLGSAKRIVLVPKGLSQNNRNVPQRRQASRA